MGWGWMGRNGDEWGGCGVMWGGVGWEGVGAAFHLKAAPTLWLSI